LVLWRKRSTLDVWHHGCPDMGIPYFKPVEELLHPTHFC
jgi:hypothetical protein